ncbi:MAG TPA: rod shape-determining protein MreC [Bryobacteraceae bacterium]|jgi:rod shape-determining protein MreC|nr:rod shape-determining protein MreC [Bryobacteraceae bacterium]
METLLSRYRNVTVLLLVIFAQLVLLAYQVKNDSDVRLIRVWAVTAVTPLARTLEGARGGTTGFLQNYVVLRDTRAENQKLRTELGKLKLENQFLKTELSTADRAKALEAFEAHTPSKMVGARVIATAAGGSNTAVFVDRGSTSGVQKGMAVVTPDGIVGKVLAAYPTASQVLLVTDPSFAAGVVSQKNHVRGILKGMGHGNCRVDYVQNEEKVETAEWFYTSGDDRIFPKGMPAGQVTSARPGSPFQEISVEPSGMANGLEEVLIILEGVHQEIPDIKTAAVPIYLAPQPPNTGEAPVKTGPAGAPNGNQGLATDADRMREHYKELGDAQNHKFGENPPGTKAMDFNLPPKPTPPAPKATPSDPASPPQ